MVVSPFALLGIAVSLLMLVLVLFGYAQVYESASQLGEMRDTVAELQEENRKLQNEYDSSINLEKIETRAKELGMQQPTAKQSVTLHIPAEDTAVIAPQASTNPFRLPGTPLWRPSRACWNICTEPDIQFHIGLYAVGSEVCLAAHRLHRPKSRKYQVAL